MVQNVFEASIKGCPALLYGLNAQATQIGGNTVESSQLTL